MALVDWRLISSSEFIGRIGEHATPREQAQAFLQVCAIIRSEGLCGIILDMDHAVAPGSLPAGDFGVTVLADEMADAGLQRFALVHRGKAEPWWEGIVAELCKLGVAARGFDTVSAAKAWLPEPERDALS